MVISDGDILFCAGLNKAVSDLCACAYDLVCIGVERREARSSMSISTVLCMEREYICQNRFIA